VEVGIASYYAHEFDGRRTASGEVYDMNKLTAAHPSLPFGTIVKVTNLENEKSVEVRINDRGPFKKGRVIDVSYEAAKRLDFVRQGLVEVRVEAIGKG
jgi:rare lipoprotein A